MCIVSFIPHNDGFILTSNRDIPNSRVPSTPPKIHEINEKKIIFPVDPQGGGSWIATQGNYTGCLLNHKSVINSKKDFNSRGVLLIDTLTSDLNYIQQDEFQHQFQSFFFIIISFESGIYQLSTFCWDGQYLIKEVLNPKKTHIWLSNTIYTKDEEKRVKSKFNLLTQKKCSRMDIYDFHKNQIIKDKGNQITGSVTQINQSNDAKEIRYTEFYTPEQRLSILKV